ncbi:transcriptional regulator, MarR family [Nitrospirillum viridazoti Y2]|uniref:MarR family winged helix-turn-helix transcriptional regulator n=1 Tax=Nitrospirillum viridazoti TaxID=3144925 RepID=UPI000226593D|nr:MarR family transcriptional regulator [Nitrospirillum amazonense]EGX99483.1 transcriptional regulator, MarR family [Nitrospirillum amazonense Y2]
MSNQKRDQVKPRKGKTDRQSGNAAGNEQWTRSLDNIVAYQLRRAQEASFSAFSRRVGDAHIWPGWYSLLKILNDNPGINQTELSQATGRDKSTLTTSLRELDKAGMIVRVRDENDRRNLCLSLSENGQFHLKELDEHAKEHNREIDIIVGADNRETLLSILKKISEDLS